MKKKQLLRQAASLLLTVTMLLSSPAAASAAETTDGIADTPSVIQETVLSDELTYDEQSEAADQENSDVFFAEAADEYSAETADENSSETADELQNEDSSSEEDGDTETEELVRTLISTESYEDPFTDADDFSDAKAENGPLQVIYLPADPENSSETYLSLQEAAEVLKNSIKNRQTSIRLYVKYDSSYSASTLLVSELMELAAEHNGNATEGDYLRWSYTKWVASKSAAESEDGYLVDVTLTMTYRTTLAQEETLTSDYTSVMNSLNLWNKSEYEKIKEVYDYVCKNVSFDYTHYNQINAGQLTSYPLMYTAYAALHDKAAVCLGFTQLIYRMLTDLDVDCRIITGKGGTDAAKDQYHAWNIVRIGSVYYNIDATWDSENTPYKYFLQSTSGFVKHTRTQMYETEQFHQDHPMSSSNYSSGSALPLPSQDTDSAAGHTYKLNWRLDDNEVDYVCEDGDKEGTAKVKITEMKPSMTAIRTASALIDGKYYYYTEEKPTTTKLSVHEGKSIQLKVYGSVTEQALDSSILSAEATTFKLPGAVPVTALNKSGQYYFGDLEGHFLTNNGETFSSSNYAGATPLNGNYSTSREAMYFTSSQVSNKYLYIQSGNASFHATYGNYFTAEDYGISECSSDYTLRYISGSWKETVTTEGNSVFAFAAVTGSDLTLKGEGEGTQTLTFGNQTYEITVEGHTWEKSAVTKPATCTEDGISSVTCSICGLTEEETIEKTGHTPGETVIEHLVETSCETDGSWEEAVYCTVCKQEISRSRKTEKAAGHVYSDPVWTWNEDKTAASAEFTCTADESHKKVIKAVITTHTTGGKKLYTAIVYLDSNAYTDTAAEEEQHTHSFGSWISEYPAGITRSCSCGKKETWNNPFKDLSNNAFFIPAVWAANQGIASGKTAETFVPNGSCTRGQVVTFLWRLAGSPEPDGSNPFTDVAKTSPFYKAIIWANEKGITKGTSSTQFSPNKICTRGQVVTFLYRFAGSPNVSGTTSFTDTAPGSAFYNAILWATASGITNGVSKSAFGTNNNCTRAQVVTFLYRFAQMNGIKS